MKRILTYSRLISKALLLFFFCTSLLISTHVHTDKKNSDRSENCSICHSISSNAKYLPESSSTHLNRSDSVEKLFLFSFTAPPSQKQNSAVIRAPPALS